MINELGRKDRSYFRIAEEISMLSDHRCKIGCVVVNNHHVISTGHNSASAAHGFQARLNKEFFKMESAGCKHAEVDALLPLINNHIDLSSATLYCYRRNGLAELAMSRPCPRCMKVIKQCGIKKLKYTTADGFATEVLKN